MDTNLDLRIPVYKIQKIRSCVSCGDLLPLKCNKCIRHPERTVRVIELFNWPEILATGPCGCILIACQGPNCKETMWRHPKRWHKEGLAPYNHFYHNIKCAGAAIGKGRNTQVEIPCSYCGKPKRVKRYYITQNRKVFCNPTHYHLWKCKEKNIQAQEETRAARDEASNALLQCLNGCVGTNNDKITVHKYLKNWLYKCTGCGKERTATTCSVSSTDTLALNKKLPVGRNNEKSAASAIAA